MTLEVCIIVFFSLYILGIVFGLVDLSIDLFWRGNILETIESVVLSLSYDISSCLVVLFVSYYGGRGNIPRWIVASSFLIGFGSLLCAFPFYYGENYQLNIETEGKIFKILSYIKSLFICHCLLELKIGYDTCLSVHPSIYIYFYDQVY